MAPEVTLPVIDLLPSFSGKPEERQKVANQIHAACTATGFFYIKNHNISAETSSKALSLAKHFFTKFPLHEREKLHVKHSNQLRGWEPAGYTKVGNVKETKEAFNWGYEESLIDRNGDGMYVGIDGLPGNSNVWPQEKDFPGFFQGIKEYYNEIFELALHLLRLFALSLGCEETRFDSMVTHPGAVGRIIHYPARCSTDDELGVGAHTDYECFTILMQSDVDGLEVQTPQGSWVEAVPIEGTFVVNVSDLMMRLTNNKYKSAVHRVVSRPIERYSIPIFFSFDNDAIVDPILRDGEAAKFEPVVAGRYILGKIKGMISE
ncbi:hypothetical protein O988_00329 [Pseudogymnoascus sp. VKM F-3808]|nr:hypothetical protein O988_00329 [Pseudogymnoascus sp. VKM F-3808]